MFEVLAQARAMEVAAMSRELEQRMEWHQFKTIEKLERALRVARGRIRLGNPAPQAG
jgi:hypothetical protein